jgi:hypothetical protein
MDLLLALSALAEIAILVLLGVASEWVRVANTPADWRRFALVRAILATVGSVAALTAFVVVAGLPLSVWFQFLRAMPVWFRLGLAAVILFEGVQVWRGLRRLRRARAEQEARAPAKRNPT